MRRFPEVCKCASCPREHIRNVAFQPSLFVRKNTSRVVRFVPVAVYILFFVYSSGRVKRPSATASPSGPVEDQAGALIPSVNIALLNAEQGTHRLATTNNEGTFVFLLLPPARYSLAATREGFAPLEIKDVLLNVNNQVTLKISLNVSTVSQTVEIVDSASLISELPAVTTTVNHQFVENLPLNGRSFQSLIGLTPGVVLTRTTAGEQGQFSVNGQRADANYFTVDGVSANAGVSAIFALVQSGNGAPPAFSAASGTNSLVSVDAMQEFKVQTSTFAPEFGRTPSAQAQILPRSGTNKFHGTAFEYSCNEAFDAADWFLNATVQPRVPLRHRDVGRVLGGEPLYVPRLGENGPFRKAKRIFFFLSYEDLRLRLSQSCADVPLPCLNSLAVVGQDAWNVGHRFSLTYGPRWKFNPPRTEVTQNDLKTLPLSQFGFQPPDYLSVELHFGAITWREINGHCFISDGSGRPVAAGASWFLFAKYRIQSYGVWG